MSGDNMNYELGKREGQNATSSMIVDCPHDGDDDFTNNSGWGRANDFVPLKPLSGLILGAGTGNVHIFLEGGGDMIRPFTVPAGDSREIFIGYRITKVVKTTTTFSGLVFFIV